jgi:hypothetical protein
MYPDDKFNNSDVELIDLQLFKCHFESGREWLPLSSYKTVWELGVRDGDSLDEDSL